MTYPHPENVSLSLDQPEDLRHVAEANHRPCPVKVKDIPLYLPKAVLEKLRQAAVRLGGGELERVIERAVRAFGGLARDEQILLVGECLEVEDRLEVRGIRIAKSIETLLGTIKLEHQVTGSPFSKRQVLRAALIWFSISPPEFVEDQPRRCLGTPEDRARTNRDTRKVSSLPRGILLTSGPV